jgi:hypothetical protein
MHFLTVWDHIIKICPLVGLIYLHHKGKKMIKKNKITLKGKIQRRFLDKINAKLLLRD